MAKRKQPLPKSGKPEKEASKARPLFPLSDELANNIQSKFGGPYRHLSVHCFQALAVLERSGVTEQEIELLLPKLRQFASNVAEQSGDGDVYVNGLACARDAVGMVWREHRDSGGTLNAFQVHAIAVIAYGDLFVSLKKSQPNSWQLHTDIALQMSILATQLAQQTSALATGVLMDNHYKSAADARRATGTATLKARADAWHSKAVEDATRIVNSLVFKTSSATVAQKIRAEWQATESHFIPHTDKESGLVTNAPPAATSIAKVIADTVASLQSHKPLRKSLNAHSPILTGMG